MRHVTLQQQVNAAVALSARLAKLDPGPLDRSARAMYERLSECQLKRLARPLLPPRHRSN